MTTLFFSVGIILMIIAAMVKSFPVAAVGFYYVANTPLGEFLSIDKRYWYLGFGALDLMYAAALYYIGTPWLVGASLAFFVSSMWTFATYFGFDAGHRLYGHMSSTLTILILLLMMGHAWLE